MAKYFNCCSFSVWLYSGEPWMIKPMDLKDKHCKDIQFLDTYADERWEYVLHFMVGTKKDSISADTIYTLCHAGLIKYDSAKESLPAITAEGFQFLLKNTNSQVWYFLLQYLDTIESKGLDLVECLTLLFQLSFLTLGKVRSRRACKIDHD